MIRLPAAAWVALTLLSPVVGLDQMVREAVQARRTDGMTRVMQEVTDAGKSTTVFAALLLVAALDETAGVLTARRALLAFVPTNLVVEGIKRLVGRARPDGERKRSNAAFPSSHAANAAALAVVLARRWRRLSAVFALLAAAVAISRVVLDRHWLSDVVVGAGIGAAMGILACRWGGRLPWHARTPEPGAVPPGAEPGARASAAVDVAEGSRLC